MIYSNCNQKYLLLIILIKEVVNGVVYIQERFHGFIFRSTDSQIYKSYELFFFFFSFIFFFFNFILFLNLHNCIRFAKYQNESATGIHVLNESNDLHVIESRPSSARG